MSPDLERAREKQILAGNDPKSTGISYEVYRDRPQDICIGTDYQRRLQEKLKNRMFEQLQDCTLEERKEFWEKMRNAQHSG